MARPGRRGYSPNLRAVMLSALKNVSATHLLDPRELSIHVFIDLGLDGLNNQWVRVKFLADDDQRSYPRGQATRAAWPRQPPI